MITPDWVNRVYNVYLESLQALQGAYLAWEDAKEELDIATYVATVEGRIVGKNPEERAAVTYMTLQSENMVERELRRAYTQAKHEFALAQVEVERLQMLLNVGNSEMVDPGG